MRVAFLSMENAGALTVDDSAAIRALEARGATVEEVPWRRELDWQGFDCVVTRSTWDYLRAPQEFLETLERIEARTRLWNPLRVIRWNLRKTYLRDLAARGVRIVPTTFGEGSPLDRLRALTSPQVLKPVVSLNAEDTFVLDGRQSDAELVQIAGRFHSAAWMLQPFVRSIATMGEYSLSYFNKRYSHAVLKRPKPGDFRVQESHGGITSPVEPAADVLAAAESVIAAVHEPLLQARVDLVRLEDGSPALMELELIEPVLYLRKAAGAAERFAEAVLALRPEAR